MFFLTFWLTAVVKHTWQPGLTHSGWVCCEKKSLLPSHVHHSSISLGSLAMVCSLFPSLWLSNGLLHPSCHHERWHCLHSVLPFFFFLSTPFQPARQSQLRSLSWLIYLMYGVAQSQYFSLFYFFFLSLTRSLFEFLTIFDCYLDKAVSFASLRAFLRLQLSILV